MWRFVYISYKLILFMGMDIQIIATFICTFIQTDIYTYTHIYIQTHINLNSSQRMYPSSFKTLVNQFLKLKALENIIQMGIYLRGILTNVFQNNCLYAGVILLKFNQTLQLIFQSITTQWQIFTLAETLHADFQLR